MGGLYPAPQSPIIGYQYRRAAGVVYQLPMFPGSSSIGSTSLPVNVEHAQPFNVSIAGGLPVASVSVNVGTAAANAVVRIGIRGTDPATGLPAALLAEVTTAQLAVATVGVKTATPAATITVPPGLWWLSVVAQTVAPTLSSIGGAHPSVARFAFSTTSAGNGGSYTSAATVTGAMPATAPAWTGTQLPLVAALTLA